MNKCGDCEHARSFPQDISKRICKGAPPQAVVTGQQIQMMWPIVGAADEGCGMFKDKILVDSAGRVTVDNSYGH